MAVIVFLPTAALHPITNPVRRGRYPRGVVGIWRGRVARNLRAAEQRQRIAQLDYTVGIIGTWTRMLQTAQVELAMAKAKAHSLRSEGGTTS